VPSGATFTNSGTATGFGGGKVLQVVGTTKTDVFTTSAASWTDVTGLTVTTGALASTSSRVLVMANVVAQSVSQHTQWKIVDGAGADITGFIGDADGSRTRSTSGNLYWDGNAQIDTFFGACLIDSPASVSAQTYKITIMPGGYAIYVNRATTNTDAATCHRAVSSITAWEIGA
jgi:hypothetical protein